VSGFATFLMFVLVGSGIDQLAFLHVMVALRNMLLKPLFLLRNLVSIYDSF
jgi:hypothetical protein